MTLQEFLDKLAKTPRDWGVGPDGMGGHDGIRLNGLCPIEAVGKVAPFQVAIAIRRLHIRKHTAQRLMHAADDSIKHADYDSKLRARILEACGI